jgi:acetoin utilization protein AcuC
VVALGGGGYDLPNVARAWTAAWAAMNEVALAPDLPPQSRVELARHGLTVLSLWDPPLELPADTRRWAEDYARRQVAAIRDSIFPRHGL